MHPKAVVLIEDYLREVDHGEERHAPLFRPVRSNYCQDLDKPLSPTAVYQNVVIRYAQLAGIHFQVLCPQALRGPLPRPQPLHQQIHLAQALLVGALRLQGRVREPG